MTAVQILQLMASVLAVTEQAARSIKLASEIVGAMQEEHRTEITKAEWDSLREARELARAHALAKLEAKSGLPKTGAT